MADPHPPAACAANTLQAQAEQFPALRPLSEIRALPLLHHTSVCTLPGAAGRLAVPRGSPAGHRDRRHLRGQWSQHITSLSVPDHLAAVRTKRNNPGGNTSTGRKPLTPREAGTKWPGGSLPPSPPCVFSGPRGPTVSQLEEGGCRQLSDRSPLRPHPSPVSPYSPAPDEAFWGGQDRSKGVCCSDLSEQGQRWAQPPPTSVTVRLRCRAGRPPPPAELQNALPYQRSTYFSINYTSQI